MKFRVYDEKAKEREVFFKLEQGGNTIDLVACDCNGVNYWGGLILSISPDGVIYLWVDVPKETGLQTDSAGYVLVEKR